MNVSVNGEQRDFAQETTLQALIEDMNLEGKRYAVEVNREIIPKRQHSDYILTDGDIVEIVHAVGGG